MRHKEGYYSYESKYRKRFKRNQQSGKICGVCAGVADYFEVDSFVVRTITVVAAVFAFWPTVVSYAVAAIVMDR